MCILWVKLYWDTPRQCLYIIICYILYYYKTVGFLRHNLAFAPRHTKEVAYITLVRPKLEYAAPIWHPYHETQIGQVEKVQRTAARWTCRRWRNTSSVGDMLDDLELPYLETRREQSSLTFFYKIHSGTVFS